MNNIIFKINKFRLPVMVMLLLFIWLVNPAGTYAATQFPDVPASVNYYKPVTWAVERGIVRGYGDGRFGPEDSCTREQFVVMIWRLADKPQAGAAVDFSDVAPSRSTYRAMQWAVENGIIKGFADGSFRPEDTVTRQQVAIMLWRMAGEPAAARSVSFTDFNSTSTGYKAVQWGSEAGLIKGFPDGSFGPGQNCLRQQIVIFLYRYVRDVLGENVETGKPAPEDPTEEQLIYASNGRRTITIKPADNSSAEAFIELLKGGDITVDMHDYGNFEKVGPLGATLPRNDEQITTEPGDVILYLGNQITIYYAQNTWNFTRLGKVQNMTENELREFLGDGDVTITFSLG